MSTVCSWHICYFILSNYYIGHFNMNAAKFLQLYLSISLVFVGNIIIPAMELNLLSYISKLKKNSMKNYWVAKQTLNNFSPAALHPRHVSQRHVSIVIQDQWSMEKNQLSFGVFLWSETFNRSNKGAMISTLFKSILFINS